MGCPVSRGGGCDVMHALWYLGKGDESDKILKRYTFDLFMLSTIKEITSKNVLFKVNKTGYKLQLSGSLKVKTLWREKHCRRLKILWGKKTCYNGKKMGFHDVTVQFNWRHADHILVYGCGRIYEIIDPSKQQTRERLMHSINSPAKRSTDMTCNGWKVMRRN